MLKRLSKQQARRRGYRNRKRVLGRRSKRQAGKPTVLNMRKTDNYATVEETVSAQVIAGETYNDSFIIGDLTRAPLIAQNFQYYRITNITMRFKPQADTFQFSGGANIIPSMYFLYDRANTLPELNAQEFEDLGAKPIRFDDKIIVKKLKPSVVLIDNAPVGGGLLPANVTYTPWLPCSANPAGNFVLNNIDHHGVVYFIEKVNANDATPYDCDITYTVQFKAPAVKGSESSTKKRSLKFKGGMPEQPTTQMVV